MKEQLRSIHPLAWTIIVGTIFGRMATSMSIPFLSIYLTTRLGVSPFHTGVIVSVSSLVGIFASFYGGYISDRIGRRKVMLVSIASWALVFVAFALAEAAWAFFVINALNGLCRSLFEPTSRALLSDVTPKEKRLLIYNMRYAAINVGVVAGPLLGLMLGSASTGTPFMVAAGVYALYGVLLLIQFARYASDLHIGTTAEEAPLRMGEAFRTASRDPVFMPILLGTVFCVMGYAHSNSTMPQFLSLSFAEGTRWFTYMLTVNAVCVLAFQYPLVRLASRFSPVNSLIAGNICIAVSLLLCGMLNSGWMFILDMVLFTVGEVLLFTMLDVLIDQIADAQYKGTYFGTIGFNNLGSVLAPLFGGWLLDIYGQTAPLAVFVPVALSVVIGIPFLLVARRRLAQRTARIAAQGGESVQQLSS
ncbi:MDR family MFS transporter [Paenibacillus sp. FSL M7-0134]|uniref:MDR family MFS transporter n=1 Tax=Paenibacillus sp. FSL M7-0134 TaxID=2954754 RepID=UPI0030FC42DD